MTPGTLARVPNQPRTPMRSFRCEDRLWDAAREAAAARGESVTEVLRRALEAYVQGGGSGVDGHANSPNP